MLIEFLKILVAGAGVSAVLLCIGLCVYFIRSRHRIGRAVGYDKLAEGILSGMTLVFAFTADGVWDIGLSPVAMAMMRLVMFGTSIVCSLHLAYATRRIISGDE